MRDPPERTKVVVRQLPPGISKSALLEQIDGRFAGRYKWVRFHHGRNSQTNQRHSRLYIDFNQAEDVLEFANFFNGHIFVNEKGTHFKALVEYAPSQRVPKAWSKKDGREGTISKDPEYLEFLEFLSKPVENLPSAEIQLEKKEAERAGGLKEAPIVTPLMQFVRDKLAAKSVPQRVLNNVKLGRRGGNASSGVPSSSSSKRGSDRRTATSKYVVRDSSKNAGRRDKQTFLLASRQDQKQLLEGSSSVGTGNGNGKERLETVPCSVEMISRGSGTSDYSKKKVVLLKGKERDISFASGISTQNQSLSTSPSSSSSKHVPRHACNNVIISNVLSKEVNNVERVHIQNVDRDRRPPRPPSIRSMSKDRLSRDSDGDKISDDKVSGNEMHFSVGDKQDKRFRKREKHDRSVWAPLRRSDGAHAGDISITSHNTQHPTETMEHTSNIYTSGVKFGEDDMGFQNSYTGRFATSHDGSTSHCEPKGDLSGFIKSDESRSSCARGVISITENGVHRHVVRRGLKESEGSGSFYEGKHLKRGMIGYGSHEKQKWIQKPGSG